MYGPSALLLFIRCYYWRLILCSSATHVSQMPCSCQTYRTCAYTCEAPTFFHGTRQKIVMDSHEYLIGDRSEDSPSMPGERDRSWSGLSKPEGQAPKSEVFSRCLFRNMSHVDDLTSILGGDGRATG